jgi:hypothetical protein
MVPCPNCSTPMAPRTLESSLGARIEVGVCSGCSLLWFDRTPSSRLGPAGVLELFKVVGSGGARPELRSPLPCARCATPLTFTHDLQHATRFTYWRCLADHSQLINYTQFLLEKNFVRPPSAEELARLRATVREITCSQCGAAIDLAKDSACPYCHAPIALIDPDSVAKAVRELSAAGQGQVNREASAMAGSTVHDAQLQAIFDRARIEASGGRHDLLEIGVGAIGRLLHGLL